LAFRNEIRAASPLDHRYAVALEQPANTALAISAAIVKPFGDRREWQHYAALVLTVAREHDQGTKYKLKVPSNRGNWGIGIPRG
jgi:hypothetical protein